MKDLFTIGFTQKGAERFFELLMTAGVETVIDVRLNNTGQLSGFAKKDDLAYLLRTIVAIAYRPMPILAPTGDLLAAYQKRILPWEEYRRRFIDLMRARKIERELSPSDAQSSCLLCSEHQPHRCHRLLVAEYLNAHWRTQLTVKHLV